MWINYSLWHYILFILSTIYLSNAAHTNRENLARRHPCNSINRRLEPYIKWTEKLASTQYKVQKDACGHIQSGGPACCTNEIFNSYALSLGHDLKTLFDGELGQLTELLSRSDKQIDMATREYITEFRRITISSLETLFGSKEYHSNIQHTLSTLFNILGNHQSTDDDVSKSSVNLFDQLILSSYRRFMTHDNDLILNDQLQKCLISTAYTFDALPKQRELLYALTSAASLVHILRTLFIYIDADIQRLKTTITLNSQQCLQRYAREALCPICVGIPSALTSSIQYDNNINEPLCEKTCHYVMQTCFDQTHNPYIAFTLLAQGYSNVIKQIQESVVELKLVERLSKLHIYLYDMVVNATNNRVTYMQLQTTCRNPNAKPFSPMLSIPPITSERRELVTEWNEKLHSMLDQLQRSIDNLNHSLTQEITTHICSNSKYAVKSNQCTQIDQHTPGNFTQWPLPSHESHAQIVSNINAELTRNQLNELQKKMTPIQQIIISFRPKKKEPLFPYVPTFDYDSSVDTNDNDAQSGWSSSETYENDEEVPLSDKIYNELDGKTTDRPKILPTKLPENPTANHSKSITYSIAWYLLVFVTLIIHRTLLMNK